MRFCFFYYQFISSKDTVVCTLHAVCVIIVLQTLIHCTKMGTGVQKQQTISDWIQGIEIKQLLYLTTLDHSIIWICYAVASFYNSFFLYSPLFLHGFQICSVAINAIWSLWIKLIDQITSHNKQLPGCLSIIFCLNFHNAPNVATLCSRVS